MINVLQDMKFLLLDCQTTGMHPSTGSLLEVAWAIYEPASINLPKIESRLIKLADDISIPQRITDITGITASDLSEASLPINVAFELKSVINSLQEKQIAVIHYARFELAFLKNLFQSYFGSDDLGINVLCSQKITKILYPSLPSPNIRAVMGFFGLPVGGFKRAANHVLATLEIWKLFYSIS